MGWLNHVVRETRATKTQGTPLNNPSQWLIDLFGGPDSATGIKVTEDNALQANAVWACVRIISETIAALPLHTYRNLAGGGKEKATNYGLYDLLHDQPNPEMSSVEWREAALGHLLLWGNSYSEIESDQADRPVGIWPLRPDKMMVWRNEQTRRLEYIYQLWQGGTVYLAPEQVLHIRTLSRDGILGLSPISQQREAIGLGLALERYGGALFGNGANPGGILSVPGTLTKDAKTRMRESWEEQHRGPGNAGRTAVLEQGVSWQATGMPPEDAQYILGRQFSLQEVARIYRLSPHKLQDLSRATFSNIEQLGLEFVSDTLLPYLVRFEQAVRRSLVPERERSTYFVRHAVDGLLRGALTERYAAYAVGRQWGWLSADDIREKEDLNPLPDGAGEDYLVPLNMVPAGQSPPAAPAAAAPPVDEPPATAPADGMTARMLESFLADVGRRLVAREDADICRAARKWLGRRRPEEFRRWLGGFIQEHRAFVALQVLPVLRVVDEEFAEEMADEFAERHLRELGRLLTEFGSVEELEERLATWRTERPAQLAQRETRRALRGVGLESPPDAVATLSQTVSRLAEPREAAQVTVENHQAPVRVDSPVTIADGAVRVETGAPQTTIAEGAVKVDVTAPPGPGVTIAEGAVHVETGAPQTTIADGAIQVDVAAAPAPDVTIQEGAVRVDVQPAEVTIAEGAMRVDVAPPPPAQTTIAEGAVQVEVAPAEVNIADGAVRVDVAPPPPAEVNIAEGAVRVDVAAPPPAEVVIAEGAVQVDIQPPEMTIQEGAVQVDVQPAPVTIAEGAVQVDVQAPPAPQVVFQEGAVKVEQPPKPPTPKPRLAAARRKAAAKEKPDAD